MALNGVMAVTLRYFTEFDLRRFVAEFMHESTVFCSVCTMSSIVMTFTISSLDEFLILYATRSVRASTCFGQ